QDDAPVAETPDANLGALQVAHDADLAPAALGHLAQPLHACPLVVAVAVREIDARDVEAALHHAGEALGIVGGRSQRGDDLRAAMQALHGTNYRIVTAHTEPGTPVDAQPRPRSSRTATAGSCLPSTNSRKAPPPGEM